MLHQRAFATTAVVRNAAKGAKLGDYFERAMDAMEA